MTMMAEAWDASAEDIEKEIRAAENALEDIERKQLALEDSQSHLPDEPVAVRLARIDKAADDLLLTQEITEWTKRTPAEPKDFTQEAENCERLAQLLCRHKSGSSSLYAKLYEDEYLPLYDYVRAKLLASLRQELYRAKYPTSEGCEQLLKESRQGTSGNTFSVIASCSEWLTRLKAVHQQVVSHVEGTSVASSEMDEVILELFRPFVERVRYHFIEQSADRPTSSRIDRLPEWLLAYIRENLLEGGPWELISYGLSPSVSSNMPIDFLNEIIRLVEWVFCERNFFRHPKVAGEGSKPILLCNAIEQILQFDYYLRELIPAGQSSRLLSLTDIFVAGDDELMRWWLQRERESAFATLFDESVTGATPVNRISPRAELFCALVRSIQAKAAVFSFSGPYLSHVAAPLCMRFLDDVHKTATDLRYLLTQRKVLSDVSFKTNIEQWIELINGTHASASVLTDNADENAAPSLSGEQDLVRFGRSLQRLEEVLVEDFANAFVDTLLMERAKLAAYLMRCSHLLSSDASEIVESVDLSPELKETQRLLSIFLQLCREPRDGAEAEKEVGATSSPRDSSQYTPRLLRDKVLALLAAKLLEVALDITGMTPDLLRPGSLVFARDVNALFGTSLLPSAGLRLLDVARLMSMEGEQLAHLGDALCGLAEEPPPLSEELFTADNRLYEEAISMVRTKGLVWIELDDALAILNRRRDLAQTSAP